MPLASSGETDKFQPEVEVSVYPARIFVICLVCRWWWCEGNLKLIWVGHGKDFRRVSQDPWRELWRNRRYFFWGIPTIYQLIFVWISYVPAATVWRLACSVFFLIRRVFQLKRPNFSQSYFETDQSWVGITVSRERFSLCAMEYCVLFTLSSCNRPYPHQFCIDWTWL